MTRPSVNAQATPTPWTVTHPTDPADPTSSSAIAVLTDDYPPRITTADGYVIAQGHQPITDGRTCVDLIEQAMAAGYVVTREPRTHSPNSLSFPCIAPPSRKRRPNNA